MSNTAGSLWRWLAIALGVIGGLLATVPPAGATVLGSAPARQTLEIVVPLVADDAGLQSFADAVSTPRSPLYGHYEPIALLARRFGAMASTRARATRFLAAAGARQIRINPTGMFAEATFTVVGAERVFRTQLARFHTPGTGTFIAPEIAGQASAAAVALPPALRGVATGVVGLDTRPLIGNPAPSASSVARGNAKSTAGDQAAAGQLPSAYPQASGTPAGCPAAVASGGFTPNQYLTAYGYTPLRQAGLAGEGERVALIEIDGFKYSDLRAYATCFGLSIPRLSVFHVGSNQALPAGGESTLDLEVLDSVAPDLADIDVYENAGDAAEVTRSLALPLITPGAKPQVVSASLGLCEPDMIAAFGQAGLGVIDRDVELAAATGVSVVAASGDNGSSACVDAHNQLVDQLAVSYPASSPWVTAVGGTNFTLTAANTIQQQVVWNDAPAAPAAGGGGFSDVFGRPSYQQHVVSGARRSVPDVAMLADLEPGYAVYCTAANDPTCADAPPWHSVGGTSAASPLLAGGAALVDQDLHRHARELLGFMNPLLYAIYSTPQRGSVFSDVIAGDDDLGPYILDGDGQPLGCCSAKAGFDAASGLGSIDLAALDLAAQSMLPRSGNLSVAIPRSQHPVRARTLRVKLHCSLPCRAYAFAVVTINSGGAFSAKSAVHGFRRAGTQTVSIGFSTGQLGSMRSGLAKRQRVEAEVFGVTIGPHGETADVTAGLVTSITS